VEKINGAMMDLIRFKKRIESGLTAVPHSGMTQPSKMPSTRPIIIFHVSEIFSNRIVFPVKMILRHKKRKAYTMPTSSIAIDRLRQSQVGNNRVVIGKPQ